MSNADLVEGLDGCDSFHVVLHHANAVHGKGRAVAIVWDENRCDNTKVKLLRGLVTVQLQYGQAAFKFAVELRDPGEYILCFRGRRIRCKSDYFDLD